MNYKLYQASKESNLSHVIIAVLIGIIGGFLLGWLYSIMPLIPIIYIKGLITIGFGLALAYLVQFTCQFLKIRSKKAKYIILTITIIIAYYSHWVSFIVQTYGGKFPSFNDYSSYWLQPNGIFNAITEINKIGTWGLGYTSNVPINKFMLTIIWIGEAAILFVTGFFHVYREKERPYSETLNKWYPKKILDEQFENIYSLHLFCKRMEQYGIDYILELKTGFAVKHSEITLYYLEQENKQYVSIDNIFIEVNNDSKKNKTPIIPPIEISTRDAKLLMETFGIKKTKFLK